MKTVIDLIGLCIGIIVYQLMVNGNLNDAYEPMYWCCFGGGYVGIKNAMANADKKRGSK